MLPVLATLLSSLVFQAPQSESIEAVLARSFPGLAWEAPGVLSVDPVLSGATATVDPPFFKADEPLFAVDFSVDIGPGGLRAAEWLELVIGDAAAFPWTDARLTVRSQPPLPGLSFQTKSSVAPGNHVLKIRSPGPWPAHARILVHAESTHPLGLRMPQSSNPQLFWALARQDDSSGGYFAQIPMRGGAVLPRSPHRLQISLPTVAQHGSWVQARLSVLDERDNPAPGWLGTARIVGSDGRSWSIPAGALIDGHARLEMSMPKQGVFFECQLEAGALQAARSNPVILLTKRQARGYQLKWADMQVHTRRSDGSGPLRWNLYRAAVHGVSDALAITDHDRLLPVEDDARWFGSYVGELDRPAPFRPLLVIPGWEWTLKFKDPQMGPGEKGHRCVYFSEASALQPVRSSLETQWDSLGELLPDLAQRSGRIVAPPHHLRHYMWWDPDGASPALLDQFAPVCEVLSRKGNYEEDDGGRWRSPSALQGGSFRGHPGMSWLNGLQQNRRTGAMGGSDTHWGYGGLWVRPADGRHSQSELPFDWAAQCDCAKLWDRWLQRRGALTALFVEQWDRDGALESLQARRCYASSGPQIALWYTVNGAWMGEEQPWNGSPVRIQGHVAASSEILSIEVRRVGPGWSDLHLIHRGFGSGERRHSFEWIDPQPPQEAWLAYYLRVRVRGYTIEGDVQLPEERAVGSPVWLDR